MYTLDPEKKFTGSDPQIQKINRLAAAIYFSCQGRIFIHAGEEFGRTKGGIKNSYCSSAAVNRLDWQRAWENKDLVNYYRGLIALRKLLPGLQDKSSNAGDRILQAEDVAHNCAAVYLDNRGGDSPWQRLCLCFNCGNQPAELTLPDGDWQVLVDGEDSFLWKESVYRAGKVKIPAKSAFLLGK